MRESTNPGAASAMLRRAGTSIALLMLLLAVAAHLDRSELSEGEGLHALAALGPLENDGRRPALGDSYDALHAVFRGWAMVVGTTERMLRLLPALGLVLAALVTAEAAARLAGRGLRAPTYLVFAASPMLARTDLLHPGLLAALPAALVLGSLVFARGGSGWWILGGAVGSAAIPFLDPRVLVPAALAAPAIALAARPAWRAPLLLLALLGPLAAIGLARGDALELPEIPAIVPGEPGLLASLLVGGDARRAALAAAFWLALLVVVGSSAGRKRALAAAGALAIAAATFVLLPRTGSAAERLGGAGAAFLLPGSALLVAGALSRVPPLLRALPIAALALLVALALVPAIERRVAEMAGRRPPEPEASPIRQILAEARAASEPGGRFIVGGPLRFGILYYSRRGHDPGVPMLVVPEDFEAAELAGVLRDQLRVIPGNEDQAPPILIHPRPEEPPPGLELLEEPAGSTQLARLRLETLRADRRQGSDASEESPPNR